jgi:hypothetical protein
MRGFERAWRPTARAHPPTRGVAGPRALQGALRRPLLGAGRVCARAVESAAPVAGFGLGRGKLGLAHSLGAAYWAGAIAPCGRLGVGVIAPCGGGRLYAGAIAPCGGGRLCAGAIAGAGTGGAASPLPSGTRGGATAFSQSLCGCGGSGRLPRTWASVKLGHLGALLAYWRPRVGCGSRLGAGTPRGRACRFLPGSGGRLSCWGSGAHFRLPCA